MKTLKQLREEKVELIDKAQSIMDVAGKAARELSEDEAGEVDRILGKGKAGDKDHVAGEVHKIDEAIARQEAVETRMAELAKVRARSQEPANLSISVKDPLNRQRHGALKGYANREEAFRAGCWFAATILGHAKAEQYCREIGIQQALAGNSGGGGFLVPEEMERAIIRLVETYGVFRQNCRVVPMTSDTLAIPRRTGGVTAYYVNEVPSRIGESSPTAGMANLVAKVLAVRTLVSRDLLEDAIIDVVNWITQEIALAFAQAEDTAGFIGDGTSTYGGIVGLKNALLAGSEHTALAGNISYETLDLADFEAMVGKLPQYAKPTAKWYISSVGYWASMARLLDAAGGNTMMMLSSGPSLQFLGFPVVISQVMNATLGSQTSTEGLAFFGSLDMAASLGNRRGIETQILRELYAATRQVGIITTQRFDINVHETGTASVCGPVIQLLTPGA